MRQFFAGIAATLLIGGTGFLLWQATASDPAPLPKSEPPPEILEKLEDPKAITLPEAGPNAPKRGPAPPSLKAFELTKEQKRFNRYDRDRNDLITRVEMLSTRSNAFKKLDKNGDNLLTFEEWAVKTSDRFAGADANRDKVLTRQEFATTRPKRRAKPKCDC